MRSISTVGVRSKLHIVIAIVIMSLILTRATTRLAYAQGVPDETISVRLDTEDRHILHIELDEIVPQVYIQFVQLLWMMIVPLTCALIIAKYGPGLVRKMTDSLVEGLVILILKKRTKDAIVTRKAVQGDCVLLLLQGPPPTEDEIVIRQRAAEHPILGLLEVGDLIIFDQHGGVSTNYKLVKKNFGSFRKDTKA